MKATTVLLERPINQSGIGSVTKNVHIRILIFREHQAGHFKINQTFWQAALQLSSSVTNATYNRPED